MAFAISTECDAGQSVEECDASVLLQGSAQIADVSIHKGELSGESAASQVQSEHVKQHDDSEAILSEVEEGGDEGEDEGDEDDEEDQDDEEDEEDEEEQRGMTRACQMAVAAAMRRK